jgi:hypothetical protein
MEDNDNLYQEDREVAESEEEGEDLIENMEE